MRTPRLNMKLRVLAILAVLAVGFGCTGQPGEGDRCNPALTANSSDECGSGLTCSQPANCAENYCCKVDSTGTITSTVANCQPGCDPCAYAASLINPPPECIGLGDGGGG